jgi:hypothetical protein
MSYLLDKKVARLERLLDKATPSSDLFVKAANSVASTTPVNPVTGNTGATASTSPTPINQPSTAATSVAKPGMIRGTTPLMFGGLALSVLPGSMGGNNQYIHDAAMVTTGAGSALYAGSALRNPLVTTPAWSPAVQGAGRISNATRVVGNIAGKALAPLGVAAGGYQMYAGQKGMNQMAQQYGGGGSDAYKNTQTYRDMRRGRNLGAMTLAGAGVGAALGGGVFSVPGAFAGAAVAGGIGMGIEGYNYFKNRVQGIDTQKQGLYTHVALNPEQELGSAEGFMNHLGAYGGMNPYTKGNDNRTEATGVVQEQIREAQRKAAQNSAANNSTSTRV